jgi:hypothetical protein
VKPVLLLLGLSVLSRPLLAQTVVQPAAPLDSARVVLRDALLVLRDSLVTIDGAAARLQRDYQRASAASLLSRARVMRDACTRSISALPPARQTVLEAQVSDSKAIQKRKDLIGAMDHLNGVLEWCRTEFTAMSQPDQAERVRGYANDRAGRVLGALRQYDQSLRNFLAFMGIKVMPLGAGPPPLAG